MFEKIIARTASALKRRKIPYMIIGGQAVLLYGSPRLTKDIDITLGVGTEKLPLLEDSIKEAALEPVPEDPAGFAARTFVLPAKDKKSGIRVDFIFSFTPYERLAISRARDVRLAGSKVKFASVEDVVIHKIFAGRPRDIEDARSVLVKNPDCDTAYIRKWLGEFDRAAEGRKFRRLFSDILKSIRALRTG